MNATNTFFDYYHPGSAGPPADPDIEGGPCHLRENFRRGMDACEGDSYFWLYTGTVQVPLWLNVRDNWEIAPGGTMYIPSRNGGTEYTIIFIERERSFKGQQFFRVYVRRGAQTFQAKAPADPAPLEVEIALLAPTVSSEGGSEPIEATCGSCELVPSAWTFTLSGIGDGTCDACAQLNGTHTLEYSEDPMFACNWFLFLPAEELDCIHHNPTASLAYIPGEGFNIWVLKINAFPIGAAEYHLSDDDWDCLGENTLEQVINGSEGFCTGWPTSITVSPA